MYYPWQLLCFTAVILTADKDKHSREWESILIQEKQESTENALPPIIIPHGFYIYMFLIFCNVRECVTMSDVYC